MLRPTSALVFALTCGVFLTACPREEPRTPAQPVDTALGVSNVGDYKYLFMVVTDLGDLDDEDAPYAVVEIRNELDRSVTVDFDGASHYGVSVGDRGSQEYRMDAGSYAIRASAAAVSRAPEDLRARLEPGRRYRLTVEVRRGAPSYRN